MVEVLNQRAVTTRTEEQLAVFGTERSAVGISGEGVCAGQLLRERDVVLHAELLLELRQVIGYMLPEERQMVMADREMQIGCRPFVAGRGSHAVLGRFRQMLQRGRTRAIAIFME